MFILDTGSSEQIIVRYLASAAPEAYDLCDCGGPKMLLEIGIVTLSVLAFYAFDRYVIGCDRL